MKEFEASRLSEGNNIKPNKIRIDEFGVTLIVPGLLGDNKKMFAFREILSISIDTPLIGFSKIRIESVGRDEINTSGFLKDDATIIKQIIDVKLSEVRRNTANAVIDKPTTDKEIVKNEIPKMFDEQLEKLIELAFVDNILSEKEREIILRKAEKLGLDVDEVEMYLENKISAPKNIEKPIEETTVTEEQKTDTFDIEDDELVRRCKLWVSLVLEKRYEGNIKLFPTEKRKSDAFFNKIGETVFTDKNKEKIKNVADGITKASDSSLGSGFLNVVGFINNIVPTKLGNVIEKASDIARVTSDAANSPKNNSHETENIKTIYVHYENEQIYDEAKNYLDILRKRSNSSSELNNKYLELLSLLEINKKKHDDSIGFFGKTFNNLF